MSSDNFDEKPDDKSNVDAAAEPPADEKFEIEPKTGSLNFASTAYVQKSLKTIASLKLTVTLFALSLVLVLAGTVAQAIPGNDIWGVVNRYFRVWFTWLDVYSFHPLFRNVIDLSGVSPKIGIWFPGGFLIGSLMGANLLAAHSLKFKVQAKGVRLVAGSTMMLLGVITTWLVIESGHTNRGTALQASITWDGLWTSMKILSVLLCGLNAYALQHFHAKDKKVEFRLLCGSMAVLLLVVGWMYFGDAERFSNPAMRILWQLGKSLIAAVVLLAGCLLLFKKRAGVVLLHGGIALMMVNEVVVHLWHVETRVTMYEGDTVNFAEDIRESEFVFVNSSDKDFDEIVSFPSKHLETAASQGIKLQHDDLPFDVKVLEFFTNSDLNKSRPTKRVTQGVGTQIGIVSAEPVAGTDTEGVIDINSAIVQLTDKKTGQDAGVVVVSVWFGVVNVEGQNVVVDSDGNSWDLQLRNKRYYKPYSVTLIDTSRDDYVGTSQVKDYRSLVRIYDPEEEVDTRHEIWMNNPLRYSGETFYQSDHRFIEGRERSVLSVVQNTGWLIPYISCVIVGVGMLAHFWVGLVRFLRRVKPAESTSYDSALAALFPWAMAIMMAMYFYSKSRVPHTTEVVPDLFKFGQIPVIYEGRDQPLDSLARNSMRLLCKKDTFVHVDPATDDATKIPAIQWMYDLMTDPQKAEAHRIFRIDHPSIRKKLKLQLKRKSACYSKAEFLQSLLADLYHKDLSEALKAKDKHRTAEQRAVVEFFNKLRHYENLRAALDRTKIVELEPQLLERMDAARNLQTDELPRLIPPDPAIPEFQGEWLVMPLIATANEARTRFGQEPFDTGKELFQTLALGTATQQTRRAAYTVEDQIGKGKLRREETIFDAFDVAEFLFDGMPLKVSDEERLEVKKLFTSTKDSLTKAQIELEKTKKFSDADKELLAKQVKKIHETADAVQRLSNQYLDKYVATIDESNPVDLDFAKTKFETFYNHFAPFWYATFAYIFAFILSCAGMLGWQKPLNRAAFYVILVTLLLHTFSLGARVYISGRPPVTNLYASAIFIGWGTVILGLIYEYIYKMGIGNLLASLLGAATLGISSLLANNGDTFKVLVAVLDTQFWLATHVTCITLGYSTTFVAGVLGVMHVLKSLFSSSYDSNNKELARMIYGTVSFGIFFSFVGTVLGGLWADDSWGRFWGWDPKENGALMIVIWNAMVLHARWDRMVGDRGLAVLAIGGNIVTSWSWFGVNELGVGLHSYGFTKGVWMALWCFWVSQFIIMGLAFVRRRKSPTSIG
jgi:ABC-type transport system involved in cytochrome c biogenesis permease subunit